MPINCFIAIAVYLGYQQIGSSLATSQEEPINVSICTSNKTISVKLDGDLCQCEPSSTASRPPSIRDDYDYVPRVSAYKLHTNAKTWNDARKTCSREKAHLAIIDSLAEENVMKKMLREAQAEIRNALTTEEAFIGIHDMFKEGEWVTVLGNSIFDSGYVKWSRGWSTGKQPDNFQGNQNCGAITNNGGLDDVDCHAKFSFFCEIPLKCDD